MFQYYIMYSFRSPDLGKIKTPFLGTIYLLLHKNKRSYTDLCISTDLSLNGGHLLAAGVLAALLGSINLVLFSLFRRILSFSKSTKNTLAIPVLIFFSSFSVWSGEGRNHFINFSFSSKIQ